MKKLLAIFLVATFMFAVNAYSYNKPEPRPLTEVTPGNTGRLPFSILFKDSEKIVELKIPLFSMVQHGSTVVMYEEIKALTYRVHINKRLVTPESNVLMFGAISSVAGVESLDWDKEYSFLIEIGRLFEWENVWDRIVFLLISANLD